MAGGNIYVGGGSKCDKLNYSVVASATKPSSPAENTIWVNTTADKELLSRVPTTKLSVYINATSGKVTTPSSSTCFTKYFQYTGGHQYRFQLNHGQTVCIASFTSEPKSGVTGTVIYGSGKTQGLETLDYTVAAPSGIGFLGIYYYDSSANDSKNVQLVVTDLTLKAELPNEIPMINYTFSSENPAILHSSGSIGGIGGGSLPSMPEGYIWFRTAEHNHNSFDALKDNIAMVYPISCCQYYNNGWYRKEMQIYQNGTWNDLCFYLFKDGVDITEITGGYVGTGSYGKFKIENGTIFTYASGGTTGACRTVNPIILDGYTTLYFQVEEFNANNAWLGVTNSTGTSDADFVAFTFNTETSALCAVDISELGSISDVYYVVMRVTGGSTSKGVKVSNIWLE